MHKFRNYAEIIEDVQSYSKENSFDKSNLSKNTSYLNFFYLCNLIRRYN